MDSALKLRVDVALTNHEWARLAQPLYFNESNALLDKAQKSLTTAEAAQKECQDVASRHGWL
jgi:type IV secretory pathway VirD2 relaxase